MSPFRQVEHTADMAAEVRAGDWASLLKEAAEGMFSLAEGEAEGAPERRRLSLGEEDAALLLRRFLSELLFWYEVDQFFVTGVEVVSATARTLEAEMRGVRAEEGRLPKMPMKAVTYHNLSVKEEEGGEWVATVVFDV